MGENKKNLKYSVIFLVTLIIFGYVRWLYKIHNSKKKNNHMDVSIVEYLNISCKFKNFVQEKSKASLTVLPSHSAISSNSRSGGFCIDNTHKHIEYWQIILITCVDATNK